MEQREIKFRAWDIENRKWNGGPFDVRLAAWIGFGWDKTEALVFVQSTGLHDKNGHEIWESDIVEYDKDFIDRPFYGKRRRFEIGFSCGSFLVLDPEDNSGERGGFSGFYFHAPALKVLGNVYEHPELLTK